MKVRVEDLMHESVITSQKHKSIGHAKDIMEKNKIHCLPIVDGEQEVLGIITPKDFLGKMSEHTPISQVMTTDVLTIPKYSGVHVAARVMRNHHIHHLVVTHEKKVVGVLSAFDLLQLVENHRFIDKNAPTKSKKSTKRQ